ncbi:hypothetical protein BRADI_1g16646v3 [Brachypodium distachyon]|uniref:F-box domain-containing protein n=1 Tax=Brachypodium distachyon TaxID=15368 RepID=A0A0Q3GVP1_BRADI|nr:hypothetical protein BRADI_1g16646v3 [Brachypodium distachyon]
MAWSRLLPELLDMVIARVPLPADRARFRAVCRPWRSAVRHHVPYSQQLPWIVAPDGSFMAVVSDGGATTTCVVSNNSDGRLVYGTAVEEIRRRRKRYFLHNPFFGATVPFPELESAIGDASDLIAVTTNTYEYPLIVCQRGRGTWLPKIYTLPYYGIIDVAFFGDNKLYVTTLAEDLFVLDLAEDLTGRPTVSNVKRVIGHPMDGDEGDDDGQDDDDEDDQDDDYDDNQGDDKSECSDYDQEDVSCSDGEPLNGEAPSVTGGSDDDDMNNDKTTTSVVEGILESTNGYKREGCDVLLTGWYLIESHGKLLMVRRQWLVTAFSGKNHTHQVDLFEADEDAGAWVPITDGLGVDVIYFDDMYDKFDMRSGTLKPSGSKERPFHLWLAWLFPPQVLVV